MQKTVSHRIISLTLALLMIFTSVGFSADFHYCKGEFKSFSLIGEATSCHTAKRTCPHHKNMKVDAETKKDCCENHKVEIDELDTDFTVVADIDFTDLEFKFITSFVYSFFSLAPPRVVKAAFLETEELLPSQDIYVLLGRFLL